MLRNLTFALSLVPFAWAENIDYKLLASSKTSTMEREMNDAGANGYAFASAMGGETAAAGNEIVVVMKSTAGERKYKLLATSKTSTMEKELARAGDEGFVYKGQTVYATTFGGREVVVILEHGPAQAGKRFEYRLLATSKTSTMERELKTAGAGGFDLMATTVSKTTFGGAELVSVMMREAK
jgi:hypothetical protein